VVAQRHAFADYPGGTAEERARRALLRAFPLLLFGASWRIFIQPV